MKLGFIGVGQGGGNLAATFWSSKKYPAMIINTAETDTRDLDIPKDLKIHIPVSEGGGAGKDTRIGEKAFEQYRDEIEKKIFSFNQGFDLIVVCAGLGGGTGTAGLFKVLEILGKQQINHSAIVTFPEKIEGTNEKLNAVAAVKMLHKANRVSPHFRSVMLIDNAELKIKAAGEKGLAFEKNYDNMNAYVNRQFTELDAYTETAAFTAFDPRDLINLLMLKGCFTFGSGFLEWEQGSSESVLAAKVLGLMDSSIFLADPDLAQAKGAAVLIERPAKFDEDGKIIDLTFEKVKEAIGSGMVCRGVYANDNAFKSIAATLGSKRVVKCFVVVAGRRFPKKYIADLFEQAQQEAAALKEKYTPDDLGIDLKQVKTLLTSAQEEEEAAAATDLNLNFGIWRDDEEE